MNLRNASFLATLMLVMGLSTAGLGGCAADGKDRSTGQVLDDTSIAARTKTALLADSTTDGLNIDVEVDRDRVQLNGFVDTQTQKNRAGEIARGIDGVASVENNLKVSGGNRQAGEYVDDKVLAGLVKAALADEPTVHSLEIDVEVNRGVVSLGGFVDTDAQRRAAVTAARNVDNVREVINNLRLR